MNLDKRVEGENFPLVSLEIGGREVADVDGACAIFGELMGGSAPDAEWAVGACFECVR